jgi:hypothetical protein
LKKVTQFTISLLTLSLTFLFSCSSPSSLHGLWQDTQQAGTIEFKSNGEVIIIDNMSATVTGTFELKENAIIFELTATDIMSDTLQPTEKRVVTAKIVKFNDNELELDFTGNEVEKYKRTH